MKSQVNRPKARSPRPLVIGAILGVVVAILLAAFLLTRSNPGTTVPLNLPLRVRPFPGPIPGVVTTVSEARAAVSFLGFPLLGQPDAKDPCTGTNSSVRLLETWVNTTAPDSSGQLGYVYSLGVWVSVASAKSMAADAFAENGELIPPEEFFAEEGQTVALRTDRVRGHVAWVKDLSPDFSCTLDDVPIVTDGSSPSPGGPTIEPEDPDVRIFDPTKTGSLRWAENGLVIHLTGPFKVDELSRIAESMSFS